MKHITKDLQRYCSIAKSELNAFTICFAIGMIFLVGGLTSFLLSAVLSAASMIVSSGLVAVGTMAYIMLLSVLLSLVYIFGNQMFYCKMKKNKKIWLDKFVEQDKWYYYFTKVIMLCLIVHSLLFFVSI